MKSIDLNLIRTDGGTQMRAELHKDTYLEYRDVWKSSPESFPPLVLFYDGSVYWLADGFHRFYGAREAGMKTVPADVRQGTQRDAILYAVGANQSNGLRRTNLDKRCAVETLLNDAEWVKWSGEKIADIAGVSNHFVSDVIKQLRLDQSSLAAKTKDEPKLGKDGKLRKPPKPKTKRKAGDEVSNPESDATEPTDTATEPEPEEPETPCDGNGVSWAEKAPKTLDALKARKPFEEMARQLSKMAKTIADDESLRLYTYSMQSVVASLRNIRTTLLDALPAYVCPYCDGTLRTLEGSQKGKPCEVCNRQGWVATSTYRRSPKGYSAK